MPNHVHALIGLVGEHVDGAGLGRAGPGSLGVVVGSYKAAVTRGAREADLPFQWQRGFYEHVVRSEATLERHRRYIEENPARWAADRYHRR